MSCHSCIFLIHSGEMLRVNKFVQNFRRKETNETKHFFNPPKEKARAN